MTWVVIHKTAGTVAICWSEEDARSAMAQYDGPAEDIWIERRPE